MSNDFEYGAAGLLGIAPPQANPTVEPEMASLVPADVTMLTTRLRGDWQDARKRFGDYLVNLEESLRGFGGIALGAFGFACTATTYLQGEQVVALEFDRLSSVFGYPIISSAAAIRTVLDELRATRIALFGPYPDWLQQASADFWTKSGFDLVARSGADLARGNTLGIYRLRSNAITEIVCQMNYHNADAIVLTGTGAPTLRAIPEIAERTGKPVLSSNLCLAWALLRAIGHPAALPVGASSSKLIEGNWFVRSANVPAPPQ
jgi:maleate isomerase